MKSACVVKGMITAVALAALVGCVETTYVSAPPPPGPVVVAPESRPPGWDRGKKRGWEANLPPGQLKKLQSGRLRIREACQQRGLSQADTNRVMVAFDLGASKGISITVVESVFAVSLRVGMTTAEIEVVGGTLGADITEVDEASLEVYIKSQMNAGIRGNALGNAIGKKLKAPKAPKPKTPSKDKGKGKKE